MAPEIDPGRHFGDPFDPPHPITGIATAITAFIGWAGQGPVGEPVMIESWLDYEATFGGLVAGAYLGYAVSAFFSNGGAQAYIVGLASAAGSILTPGDGDFEAQLTGPNGYAVLANVPLFNLLCVPGESDAGVVGQLQHFCAEQRAFLIVDSAKSASVGTGSTGLSATGPADAAGDSLMGRFASNSAFYFPWINAPDALAGGAPTLQPPSGFVAGIYANTDANRGVWAAPAGIGATVLGALGLQSNVSNEQNSLLSGLGINCLREFPLYGPVIWGAQTIAGADCGSSQWKYVPIRRLSLYIESSLYTGTQWAVFEPNNETLWAQLRLSVGPFMQSLFRQGALQGQTPDEAYFVKCDAENNPQSSIALGIVNITVGFAPVYPAEFVVIAIQQMAAQ